MQWTKCKYDDLALDTPVKKYRNFTIALAIPNGGIIGVSIWNWDNSIAETLWTEEKNKYTDEEWHIAQAIFRINEILLNNPSKKYSFLGKFSMSKLNFILSCHNINCENKRLKMLVIKAIENHGLSTQEIWETLRQYQEPETDLSDLPLFGAREN